MILNKITNGSVIQKFDTETGHLLSQEFAADDQVVWEKDDGTPVKPAPDLFAPFTMSVDDDRIGKHRLYLSEKIEELSRLLKMSQARALEIDEKTHYLEKVCVTNEINHIANLRLELVGILHKFTDQFNID